MKIETLSDCIYVLEKVRNVYNSQLDTSVLAELNDVINELKKLQESKQSNIELGNISSKALQVISQIINIVCTITNLMR